MEQARIITLSAISGVPSLPTDYVKRDAILSQIDKALIANDVVLIDGDPGIGKSTILFDFVKGNSDNCISYFVDEFDKYSYTFESFLDRLYQKIYFYCNLTEAEGPIDLNLYNATQGQFRKKIRQSKKSLYFVFDGLYLLQPHELEHIQPILEILPWRSAKFVMTNLVGKGLNVFNSKLLTTTVSVYNFGYHETKDFLKDITTREDQLQELHKLSNKGMPAKLKELKSCAKGAQT